MGHRRLSGFTQPASQAVFPALQAGLIGRAIRQQEEAGGGRKFKKMLVEGIGDGAFVFQQDWRAAPNHIDVGLRKGHEVDHLLDKPRHIGARGHVLLAAHPVSYLSRALKVEARSMALRCTSMFRSARWPMRRSILALNHA